MQHPPQPCVRGVWSTWLLRGLLVAGLAGCGGGGGDSLGTADGSDILLAKPPSPVLYSVTQLGFNTEPGCRLCINASGQVAFTSLQGGRNAFFYDGNSIRLLDSPFHQSFAAGLNDAGQVVGGIANAAGVFSAARWTTAGPGAPVLVDIGAPAGASSVGAAINAAGQVAGTSNLPLPLGGSGPDRAFLWTEGVGRVEPGTLPSGAFASTALFVNSPGQVAGSLGFNNGHPPVHPFFWTAADGIILDLGTLGAPFSGDSGTARAMNDAGQVVGQFDILPRPSSIRHAFLWTATGGMLDLGTLGGNGSSAEAINRPGQVVGQASTVVSTTDARFHAFLWSAGTGMVDLGTLGGTSSIAVAINDAGQVVGNSVLRGNGRTHAFIWTAAEGMVDLSTRTVGGVEVIAAFGIGQDGSILALAANQALVVLKPGGGGGFLTGSAHFESPPGAVGSDPGVTGRARFNANVKPGKGAGSPSGKTHFDLKAAGLEFDSTAVDWLNVQGARAQYQGSGVLNGVGGFSFSVTVDDGGNGRAADRVRIRIWHTDSATGAQVVDYDNQIGDPEGSATESGNLVVHGA